MKAFVYFNLHKKVWSLRSKHDGRVFAHARYVALEDCTFKVSEAGRQRVIRQKRKNVHAGVEGRVMFYCNERTAYQSFLMFMGGKMVQENYGNADVTYNPYKYETFVRKHDHSPILRAETVIMGKDTSHDLPPSVIAFGENLG